LAGDPIERRLESGTPSDRISALHVGVIEPIVFRNGMATLGESLDGEARALLAVLVSADGGGARRAREPYSSFVPSA
jgi:hypothetical protein